jgi:N-hydroxyarylamine O-acetyltransferase
MLAIPFENLDIPLKCEIVLDLERIYDKIVVRGRGGFCYEQNGLFGWALRQSGFDLDMLSARVARADGGFGQEFDHMLLLVRVYSGRWLADVGFGDSFVEPIRLDTPEPQFDRGMEYQIARENDSFLLLRREEGRLERKFLFTLQPHVLADYTEMCVYHQTSPHSTFTYRRVCSRATPTGRITLTGTNFIRTDSGNRFETQIADEQEFVRVLQQSFGIELPEFLELEQTKTAGL